MPRPLLRMLAVLCVLGIGRISFGQDEYVFVPIAEADTVDAFTEGDLVYIDTVDPVVDDEVEYYEIDAVVFPADSEDAIIICMTTVTPPDPGDLLVIDEFTAPAPPIPGDEIPEDAPDSIEASGFSLIDIVTKVKLKPNKKLRVAMFGSVGINPVALDPATMLLGDPSLEPFGGSFVGPIKAIYEDLDEDGFVDAVFTFFVGEMLDEGILDAFSTFLELRFEFRGIPVSERDEVEIRS